MTFTVCAVTAELLPARSVLWVKQFISLLTLVYSRCLNIGWYGDGTLQLLTDRHSVHFIASDYALCRLAT